MVQKKGFFAPFERYWWPLEGTRQLDAVLPHFTSSISEQHRKTFSIGVGGTCRKSRGFVWIENTNILSGRATLKTNNRRRQVYLRALFPRCHSSPHVCYVLAILADERFLEPTLSRTPCDFLFCFFSLGVSCFELSRSFWWARRFVVVSYLQEGGKWRLPPSTDCIHILTVLHHSCWYEDPYSQTVKTPYQDHTSPQPPKFWSVDKMKFFTNHSGHWP